LYTSSKTKLKIAYKEDQKYKRSFIKKTWLNNEVNIFSNNLDKHATKIYDISNHYTKK
jgi:hypothetical protein